MKKLSLFLCGFLLLALSLVLGSVSIAKAQTIDPQIPSLSSKCDCYYPGNQYRYVYEGQEIVLNEKTVEILSRVTGNNTIHDFSGIINSDLIDLSKFNNTSVDYLTLTENVDYGYIITINLRDESISMYRNWETWPEVPPYPVTDLPSEEEIISVAHNFLGEKNINVENYGQPNLVHYWMVDEMASGFSPIMTVLYPLYVNDIPVFSPDGEPYGMYVDVDINYMKVANIWPIMTHNYQGTSYEAETDFNEILKIAEQGGLYNWVYTDNEEIETINLGLDTPYLGYMKSWELIDEEYQEILTPALVFPLLDQPQDPYFMKNNIIVPLAKEIIKQATEPFLDPDINFEDEVVPEITDKNLL